MSSVNSVNIYSIDEERLKFRVICSVDGANAGAGGAPNEGTYEFLIPPLTAFGNSHEYPNCRINCDAMLAHIAIGINDATWTINGAIPALVRCGGIVLRLDVPSSQAMISHQLAVANAGVGTHELGGFRQLVPLELKLTGNGAGAVPANPGSYVYIGEGKGEPVICANPFGSTIRISMHHPQLDDDTYLCYNAAGAGATDLGLYVYQFTIQMVPNEAN